MTALTIVLLAASPVMAVMVFTGVILAVGGVIGWLARMCVNLSPRFLSVKGRLRVPAFRMACYALIVGTRALQWRQSVYDFGIRVLDDITIWLTGLTKP